MKISSKGRYALAALTYMAQLNAHHECITIIRISEKLGISKIYLEQVFCLHDCSADYYAKFQPKNQAERHSLSFFFLLEHFSASIDIILKLIYCLIKSQSAAVNT